MQLRPLQRLFLLAAPLLVALAAPVAVAQSNDKQPTIAEERTWWLPTDVSTHGHEIDTLFNIILWMTLIVGVGVFVVLGVFLVKYRYRPERTAKYIHGNVKLELVWTLVPALIMAATAAVSQATWKKVKNPDDWPAATEMVGKAAAVGYYNDDGSVNGSVDNYTGDAIHVEIVAKQFTWLIHYPGPDGKLGSRKLNLMKGTGQPAEVIGLDMSDPASRDDFVTERVMVIPVDKKVYIDLVSKDVLHSFFLPNFRVKQDAVPGLVGKVWLEATRLSEHVVGTDPGAPLQEFHPVANQMETISDSKPFDIVCAELCGQGHYSMFGRLFVVRQEEYNRWLELKHLAVKPAPGDTETSAGDDDSY